MRRRAFLGLGAGGVALPNRLIGLLWLGRLLYPAVFAADMWAETRRFYEIFYHEAASDARLAARPDDPPG